MYVRKFLYICRLKFTYGHTITDTEISYLYIRTYTLRVYTAYIYTCTVLANPMYTTCHLAGIILSSLGVLALASLSFMEIVELLNGRLCMCVCNFAPFLPRFDITA
jgi:hypothetical protein